MRTTRTWMKAEEFPQHLKVGNYAKIPDYGDRDTVRDIVGLVTKLTDEWVSVEEDTHLNDPDVFTVSRKRIQVLVPMYVKEDVDELLKTLIPVIDGND